MYVEFTFLQEYLFLMVDIFSMLFSICAWEFILHSDIGVFINGSSYVLFFFFGENCFSGLRPHFVTLNLKLQFYLNQKVFTVFTFKSKLTY